MFKKFFIAFCFAAAALHGVEIVKGTPGVVSWDKIKPMPFYRWVEGGKPPIDTEVRFMYNDNSLFMRFVCSEPNITEARQQPRYERHDSSIWTNDCVEIFIAPEAGSKRMYQFVTDIHNSGAELGWNDPKYAKTIAWNGYWSRKTTYFDDHYIVEVEIPWRTLGIEYARNRSIKLNITRVRKSFPWGRYSLSEKMDKHLTNIDKYLDFTGLNIDKAEVNGSVSYSVPLSGKNLMMAQVRSVSGDVLQGKLMLVASGREKEIVLAALPVKLLPGKSISKNISYNMSEAGAFPVKLVFRADSGKVTNIWAGTINYNPPIDIASRSLVAVKGKDTAVYARVYSAQTKGSADIAVIDSKGKTVAAVKQKYSGKEFFLNIPGAKLPEGDYTVRVTLSGFKQDLRLTVVPDVVY